MKKLIIAIIILTSLQSNLVYCDMREHPLKLSISKISELNKNLKLEIKIINISNHYVAFYNRFYFEKIESISQPIAELKFYIDTGKGFKNLSYIGKPLCEKLAFADPNLFLILSPKFLWGMVIELENGNFDSLPTNGKFYLKAVYENRSKSWMNRVGKLQVHFDESFTFDGIIESNMLLLDGWGKR